MDLAAICDGWKNKKLPIIYGIAYNDGHVDRFYMVYDKCNWVIINSTPPKPTNPKGYTVYSKPKLSQKDKGTSWQP